MVCLQRKKGILRHGLRFTCKTSVISKVEKMPFSGNRVPRLNRSVPSLMARMSLQPLRPYGSLLDKFNTSPAVRKDRKSDIRSNRVGS